MKVINLTPHIINIQDEYSHFVPIPPSGITARVDMETNSYKSITVDDPSVSECVGLYHIALQVTQYGKVENLPEPEIDTIYLVSALVRLAVPHRRDVVSPGELIRNDKGQPIGCRGLIVNI